MSPGLSLRAGLTSACQREPSSRLISVASIFGVGRAAEAPAGKLRRDHLGVVDDELIARQQQIGQIANDAVFELDGGAGPHHQQPRRIARLAGRSAMRSGGRSKSNRSVRID